MHRDQRVQQCFAAVLGFSEVGTEIHAVKLVYATLCGHIDALLRDGSLGAKQGHDGQAMAYAIVAFADEMAMKAGADLTDYWRTKTLQVRYFKEHAAGDNFFVRLAELRQQTSSPEVLEAYYTALALGFEGRYAHTTDASPIPALLTELRGTLLRLRDPSTRQLDVQSAPVDSWVQPQTQGQSPPMALSWWTPLRAWRVLAGSCAVCIVFFVFSSWYLRSATKPIYQLAAQCAGH